MNSVELINVTKDYPEAEDGAPRRVLDNFSLAVAPGESVAVVGPSGCGKSTLLNLMGLLDEPTSGEILLAGRAVNGLKESERARLRAAHVGFIFQLHHLLPQCTVLENVLVPTLALESTRESSAAARSRAEELLDHVGLGALASRHPAQLSGGERQRVAVVRALINQPKLILADEPTGALDAPRARDLADLLIDLNRRSGTSLVLVTHDDKLAARMDRVVQLT